MTPLPAALGGAATLAAWRLDQAKHAATWDSGEGSRIYGGRWNSSGRRAVYCSLDPSCAILEVAVHKGFKALDTVRHFITCVSFADSIRPYVVQPAEVPNPNWLRPGTPSAGQQQFGDALLVDHGVIVIPSAVASHSWNLVFDPNSLKGNYEMTLQEQFALDTRLHPPPIS